MFIHMIGDALTGLANGKKKERAQYTPKCTGRLHTDGDTVLRENPHAHPVSPRDTHAAHFVSEVKYSSSTAPPGDEVRTAYLGISDDVKTVIPSTENLRQLNKRQKLKALEGANFQQPR